MMDETLVRPGEQITRQYGAMPWRRDRSNRVQLMLITSRRRGRWIVPKGWPEKNRPSYMTAAVEAYEEAGVIGEIRCSPIGAYDYGKEEHDGAITQCRVTLFSLQVRGTLINWPEQGQRKRLWSALDEAAMLVDDPELAELIRLVGEDPDMLRGEAAA